MMPSPDPSRKELPRKESPALRCRICDKPVALENAKTDGDGQAIHEECYALRLKLEQASQDGHPHASRPWKVIAEEVTREQDSNKLSELVTELNEALGKQTMDGTAKFGPDGKTKPNK